MAVRSRRGQGGHLDVDVTQLEPGRFTTTVGPSRATHTVLVPAGVGVPGASDEDFVQTLVEVMLAAGHRLPPTFDVTAVMREHPAVWSEVERRLDD